MGILKDLEKVGKDIEHDVEQVAAEIDKELQKAVDAVETGLAKAKALIQQGFDDAEKALIKSVVDDALSKYANAIKSLRTLATEGITSANTQSIVNDIVSAFKNADGSAAAAVLSNLLTDTMKAAYSEFSQFTTLAIYSDDEIDLGFGVAAAAGGGIKMPGTNPDDSRMVMDFEATEGVEEGADLGLAIGVFCDAPKDMQGGFIAATLGADAGAGANLIVYLSMEFPPKLAGIVLDITGGEEVEASIDCGFTLAFKVPAGAVVVA
jgi:hypothetical protein